MKVHVEARGSAKIVSLSGSMTGGDERSWVDPVTKLIDESGAFVVLEMSEVNYISSAGLGDLVRLTALANTQGARLLLVNVSPFVKDVLATTRLDKFFEMHQTVDAALATAG